MAFGRTLAAMSLAVVIGGLLPRPAAAQCPSRAPAMVPEPACPPPDSGVDRRLTSSADIFPLKPLVLSSQLQVGQVKRKWTVQWRASAGVVLRGVEVMASLDYFAMKGLRFGGPMFGVRLWM